MRNSRDKSNEKDPILDRRSFPHRAGLAALALVLLLPTLIVSAGERRGNESGNRNFHNFWGQQYSPQVLASSAQKRPSGLTTILRWNQIAIDASGLDHT